MGIFFTIDRDQHIGAGHFFFAGRLYVQHGTLNHALKAQGWLRVDFFSPGHGGGVFFDILGQFTTQRIKLGPASAQDFCGGWVVQHSQ